jgi:dTDP-4-amino-4,6-dideoxygalactose transaminase
MKIPLVDLAAQHREVAEDVAAGFAKVFEDTSFVLGPAVAEFEVAYAKFAGVAHCIGVANGTDALEIILRARGIGPGDEVIIPANTFIATALAVTRTGAVPVFVDSDPVHHLMDISQVEAKIGERTKAVMAVDLYGQIAAFDDLERAIGDREIAIFEDAAQSQGAQRNGVSAGGFGLAAGVSFFPGKNLGAYGDAGAVLTNDRDFASRIERLRNWGGTVKYQHPEFGFNSRLDSLQAVVLKAKLERLPRWNAERSVAATRYDAMLAGVAGLVRPRVLPGNESVWHLYVVRVGNRDEVLAALHEAGIGAGIHYPTPCHLHGAYAFLGQGPGSFPVAEQASKEILSLPIYPGITETQQQRVVEVLLGAMAR